MTHCRRWLVALVSVVLCSTASAQTPPMSQTLLKRLGEAVEGSGSRNPVYVVARTDGDYAVVGVTPNRDAATALASRSGRTFAVFGPYLPDVIIPRPIEVNCWHNAYSMMSPRECVDTSAGRPVRTAVSVILEYENGTKRTLPLGPDADAIFLSVSAIDKFVVPYYTRVLGAQAADSMRRAMFGNTVERRRP